MPKRTIAPAIGVSAGLRLPLPFSSRKTLPEIVLFATTTVVAVAVGGSDVDVTGIFVTAGSSVAVEGDVALGIMLVAEGVTPGGKVSVGTEIVGGGRVAASCSPTIIVILLESSSPSTFDTRTLIVYVPASVGVQG